MKSEEKALNQLLIHTQEQRYKENKISGLIYNVRMNKYRAKLEEIRQELPVLESKLKKKRAF